MYILTEEYDDYDQHGEYFVAAFSKMPTEAQLLKVLEGNHYGQYSHREIIDHLIVNGGGRMVTEYHWYNLFKYEEE